MVTRIAGINHFLDIRPDTSAPSYLGLIVITQIGLIQESKGRFHKAQPDNTVMLSIVTEEVDAWYTRFKADKRTTFIKHL